MTRRASRTALPDQTTCAVTCSGCGNYVALARQSLWFEGRQYHAECLAWVLSRLVEAQSR